MKLDFVAEKIVPGYSGINSSPSSYHVHAGRALDWVLSMCWDNLFLWLSLTQRWMALVSLISPAFFHFPPDYGGAWQERKKDGEKLDCGLNARRGMPARLVFVKMCTSPQRRRETGCFTLLWQDTKQEKWPKQIKPHTNFNQGLYSLSQVKSLTNVWVWVAVKPLR